MDTNSFYKNLASIDDISKIIEEKHYCSIPSDWIVLVSDIKNSTQAIKEGKYKEVNFVAALTIIGVLNIDKTLEFPYIFGGDGASLIIPPTLYSQSQNVLLESAQKAKTLFGLELRVGAIPVQEINKKGVALDVTKLKISPNHTQAIIKGNGLELAENLLKDEYEKYQIIEDKSNEYKADFDGLECRWEAIKTPKDETISLLIKSMQPHNANEVYKACLSKINQIAGTHHERNPLKSSSQLNITFNPKPLFVEASAFSSNRLAAYFHTLKIMLENLLGVLLMKFSFQKWAEYKNRIIQTTDTEKFDDMLRMVLSTTKQESKELEAYLEEEYQKKSLVYGIHRSDSALMTCLIFERHGKHIHFVDGSNGGYALASVQLKDKLRECSSLLQS